MFTGKVKFFSFLLGALSILSVLAMNLTSYAKSGNDSDSASSQNSGETLSKEIYVSDIFELLQAVDNIRPWGKIFLKNDINMCGITLRIKKSMVIDLGGHNIYVDNNSGGMIIANKSSVSTTKVIKKYPSDYVWSDKKHEAEKPFLGGDEYELTVVDYEVKDKYNDDFYVKIQNGSVIRQDGENGKDGEPDTWLKCSGRDGETPKAPINIISGALSLINMNVTGGNGGKGGNGAHYPWPYLPFLGGCGADGGNGGDGGSAISVSRSEARLIIDKNSKVSSGCPGDGGKGGDPGRVYWRHNSKPGINGESGKIRPDIDYEYKR